MLKPESLIGRLFYYADTIPESEAVVSSALTLSYAQLAQLVRLQVGKLHQLGISNKSVIGIQCSHDIQHLILNLAATYLGATSCTIPTYESDETRRIIVDQCAATCILDECVAIEPSLQKTSLELPIAEQAAYASLLFSTSGTTGNPKLVIHQDNDLVAQAHRHIQSNKERFVCLASMEHNFAKRHRLYCVAAGATNVFLSEVQKGRHEALVAELRSLNVNVMHVSAYQAQELLSLPDIGELSDIRLKLGGSHVPEALRQKLRVNITHNLQAGYGTTETGAIAFTDVHDLTAGDTVGQALPGIELRILSPEGKPLGVEEIGELAVKSDGMFRGYLGNSEMTTKRLKDGWFYTGDLAYLDEEQRIKLCGRSDDMFVFNSMNIYPQDIESELCQFPGVIDAAVFPKASSTHGNIPVAMVVFAPGQAPDVNELKAFIYDRVGVRRPRQYMLVNDIPRNASGKILRQQAVSLSAESNQVRQTIVKVLASAATNQLPLEEIRAFERAERDIKISKSGMDSLMRMELLVALEIEYDTVITLEELRRLRFLENVISHVLFAKSQSKVSAEHDVIEPRSMPLEQGTISAPSMQNEAALHVDKPYVVRFFQRIFSYCATAAQLNKALGTLEHRLTPLEWECLNDWRQAGQLLDVPCMPKFEMAINSWFQVMRKMMQASDKKAAEPFCAERLAPAVSYFYGPGKRSEKTLVVCFSGRGGRQLSVPNTILMQYTDSARYDLLVVSEPLALSYRLGIPTLGKNEEEVVTWLSKLSLMKDYCKIRTLGFSAGGYPSIMAAYRLKAELAICINGRFLKDKRSKPVKYMARWLRMWRAVCRGACARVEVHYSVDISRDRKFAKMAARFTRGKRLGLELDDSKVHRVFLYLAERGELMGYLNSSIFSETIPRNELSASGHASLIK